MPYQQRMTQLSRAEQALANSAKGPTARGYIDQQECGLVQIFDDKAHRG